MSTLGPTYTIPESQPRGLTLADHALLHSQQGTGGTYIHNQSSASDTWVITHNLGQYPSVTVVDSANSVVIGSVLYDSDDQITLTFSGAFSGKAYLNS